MRSLAQPTPLWLTDINYPAPCFCGRPMFNDEPIVLGEGENGLKRLYHLSCIEGAMDIDFDDGYPDE